jgi:hypothetical protein
MTNWDKSLARRLHFAGDACAFFDGVFSRKPLSKVALISDWPLARFPSRLSRIAYDLLESVRTARLTPQIGNAELALMEAEGLLPQHPRYFSYWHDPALHSMVGMFLGADIIRHRGRYYIIESNHGPSIYPRRRAMYDAPYDPIVTGILSRAKDLGFQSVVPIHLRWKAAYVDEFQRAGADYGIKAIATNCPFDQPGPAARMVALPNPMPPSTMYVIHSGLTSPVTAYIDNKWYLSQWLPLAIREELPPDTPVAIPETRNRFFIPAEDNGPRWPNLVVKVAGSSRSTGVIAARFRDEAEGRALFGLSEGGNVPRQLQSEFAKNFLFTGRDHAMYQQFIPPEMDERGHARMIRLHIFVSPLCSTFLSAHFRISRAPVPESFPRGVVAEDDAFIFNNADYEKVPRDIEDELRVVADHLGGSIQRAIARKFVTSPN